MKIERIHIKWRFHSSALSFVQLLTELTLKDGPRHLSSLTFRTDDSQSTWQMN